MARVELEQGAVRRGIDANWSGRRRCGVIGVACAAGLLAVAGGAWVYLATRPPPMPRSAQQAIDTIASARFERLDPGRKSQILAEAYRLFESMAPEEKRTLAWDAETAAAFEDAAFDDYVRRVARGEAPDKGQEAAKTEPDDEKRADAASKGEGNDDGAEKGGGAEGRAGKGDGASGLDAWVAQWQRGRQSGNAQDAALRGEFWSRSTRGGG